MFVTIHCFETSGHNVVKLWKIDKSYNPTLENLRTRVTSPLHGTFIDNYKDIYQVGEFEAKLDYVLWLCDIVGQPIKYTVGLNSLDREGKKFAVPRLGYIFNGPNNVTGHFVSSNWKIVLRKPLNLITQNTFGPFYIEPDNAYPNGLNCEYVEVPLKDRDANDFKMKMSGMDFVLNGWRYLDGNVYPV